MSKQYSVTVMRHTDDDAVELVDRWITADQAIDLMLQIQGMEDLLQEEEEEQDELIEEEEEELPKPAKKKESKGKQWDVKPCCGSAGPRHKKDCPNNQKPANKREGEGDVYMMSHGVLSTHQERVTRMLNEEGRTQEDVYNAMYQEMTNEEIRKAIEHALS